MEKSKEIHKFKLKFNQDTFGEISMPLEYMVVLSEGENTIQIPMKSKTAPEARSEFFFVFNALLFKTSEYETIEVYSADYPSKKSPHLIIKTNDQVVHKYYDKTKLAQFDDSDYLYSLFIMHATQIIISQLENENITILKRSTLPDDFPKEIRENLKTVYKDGYFHSLYNPAVQYDENYTVLNIESTFGGLGTLAPGQYFANVIGSTGDPPPQGVTSWIQLWQDYYGIATICSSYQFQGFNCSNIIFGGHTILGQQALPVGFGVNQRVFIIPICNRHNSNNNVYMAALREQHFVFLNHYHQ